MTTAARSVAEAYRMAPLIYRRPWGWQNWATVQGMAPTPPRFATGHVDHCGMSVNTVHHNVGMVKGVDYPDATWTPSGLQWFRDRGRIISWANVRAGDHLYFRNAGSQFAATHVSIAVSDWQGTGVWAIGWNIDGSGKGRRVWREPGWMIAAGRPLYVEADTGPAPPNLPGQQPVPEPPRRRPVLITAATR